MCIVERVTEEDAAGLLEIYGPYVLETAISFEYQVPSLEEFRERMVILFHLQEKLPFRES